MAYMATYIGKGQLGQITFVFNFPSYLFLRFFCFTLILKCRGSRILGLGERAVKAFRTLLHLVKPALLNIG